MSFPRLVYDLSSADYHGDKTSYSSSQLKVMVKGEENFFHDIIQGKGKKLAGPSLDIGTYFHTAILEPHKLEEECAVWTGFRKGKDWIAFAELNEGKAIITGGDELKKANCCIEAVNNSPIAMSYIERGKPEISAFMEVHVYRGRIFYFLEKAEGKFNAKYLSKEGWVLTYLNPKFKTIKVGLKVRADCIGLEFVESEDELFILDLKSASGDVKNEFSIQSKISELNYDLSASLYLDVFSAAVGVQFKKFIWTFASKDAPICKNYMASPSNVAVGRAKWAKAVIDIAKYKARNWRFVDEMSDIEPKDFELAWLSKNVFPKGEIDDLEPELVIEETHKPKIIEEDLL